MSVNEQQVFLRAVYANLRRADIPYMITGSIASAHYGEARVTNDIDIVIEATEEKIRQFVAMFGEEVYVSLQAALDAVRFRAMFNLIHTTTGVKIDLILKKARAFSEQEFSRRQEEAIFGATSVTASPEDVILSKLEWSKIGNSERQIRDVAGIIRVQNRQLDFEYLRHWAKELGVCDLLEQILMPQ